MKISSEFVDYTISSEQFEFENFCHTTGLDSYVDM